MDKQLRVRLLAAGISLALGSAAALAQQPGERSDESQQRTQDSEQAPDFGRQSQQEQSQDSEDRQGPFSQSQDDQAAQQDDPGRQAQAGQQSQGDPGQIDDLTQQDQELSKFVEALRSTGMDDSLTDGTQYTIFAPSDEAFDSMQGRSLEELQQPGGEELTGLLRAHIVADDVDEEMARRIQAARTIDGGTLELSSEGDQLMIGDARVEGEPIQVGSLRVYKIDSVLSPDAGAGLAAQDEQDQDRSQIARADEREDQEQEQEQEESQDQGVFGDDSDTDAAGQDRSRDEGVFGDDSRDEGAFGDRETEQDQGRQP